ncbi:MAG: NAD(+) synthase, partial [Bacteroidaceae bacterium]|nr:NAD(+) synthase [Bacteroidaceae bacterium]
MNYGFVKVAAAVPHVSVADCKHNIERIENQVIVAEGRGAQIICFPELCLTAYTCQDLFQQQLLLEQAEMALIHLLNFSRSLDIITIVGLPIAHRGCLLNCAAIMQKGRILGLVPKTYLPNYKEFYEKRWFASAADIEPCTVCICGQQIPLAAAQLFHTPSCTFGVEICEDLWSPIPPSSKLALAGAEIIFNLSADNSIVGKTTYLQSLLAQQSARCIAGYVFSGCGFGESTQDVVFSGKGYIYENGHLLAATPRHTLEEQIIYSEIDVERLKAERCQNTTFAATAAQNKLERCLVVDTEMVNQKELQLTRPINPLPFVPQGETLDERCEEIFAIQTEGLAKRILHTHAQTVVVGISGGLDSTLALLVCVRAFDML